MNKIAVIIPAFNEALSIGYVIEAVPNQVHEIIIVDNNSTDITKDIAKDKGATVLFEPKKGYGHACLKGIDYLAKDPPDIVVFLDGDYSDFPEDLVSIIAPIVNKDARFVIGNRAKNLREKRFIDPATNIWKCISMLLDANFIQRYFYRSWSF